jgi:ubiquinone/menaquinone biosynthesis C-methylase UbiE
MTAQSDYVIRGGIEGRERLRLISRVLRPTTLDLLKRAGVSPGLSCLEIGCGGGDVARDIAEIVGANGRVLASDIDDVQLEIARAESKGFANLTFRRSDIMWEIPEGPFDLVHARFVLTHISDPGAALQRMKSALKPGGLLVVEDIDFRGHFAFPDCPSLDRYVALYTEIVRRRGGDANIGPRLPELVASAGFSNIRMNVVHPAGAAGEVKLMTPITMENIAGNVVATGLASESEAKDVVDALYAFARTPGTISGVPRIFEVWATA